MPVLLAYNTFGQLLLGLVRAKGRGVARLQAVLALPLAEVPMSVRQGRVCLDLGDEAAQGFIESSLELLLRRQTVSWSTSWDHATSLV